MEPMEALAELLERADQVALGDPQFEAQHAPQDWQRYVPERVRDAWPVLSRLTKAVVYHLAALQAEREM
jgi:hypothetical protein